ncbi:MAG TPA: phage tail protein [Acidimicrobiales bacterium]|nr:phage tail protein [Acidimicrobiales bacterium]
METAVTVCFTVNVDGIDLGRFQTCQGLGCEVTLEKREEGGNNGFIHQLPGRVKYTNVKLTRPVNESSANIASWMSSMVGSIQRRTAQVQAMAADGTVIASWSLDQVIPVKWTGPNLDVSQAKVAIETLELAHHGFLSGM